MKAPRRTAVLAAMTASLAMVFLDQTVVAVALRGGLNPNDLKLVTAAFVFAALVIPGFVRRARRKAQA